MKISGTVLMTALMLALTLGLSACVPSKDDLTPEQVVEAWVEADEPSRNLNEVFHAELLEMAAEWIARKRAGSSQSELDDFLFDGSGALVSRNAHLVARAPDAELLAYIESVRDSFGVIMDRNPKLCDTTARKSDREWRFLQSLPMTKAAAEAIVAGRKANVRREPATDLEMSSYIMAARAQISKDDLRAMDSESPSMQPILLCKKQIAGFGALASMDAATRGRIAMSTIGTSGAAG